MEELKQDAEKLAILLGKQFGKGSILGPFIHDTNVGLGRICFAKTWLERGDVERAKKDLDSSYKKIKDAIDLFLTRAKEASEEFTKKYQNDSSSINKPQIPS